MKKKYRITAVKNDREIQKDCHTSDIGQLMQKLANHGFFVVNYHEVQDNLIEVQLGGE